MAIRINSSHSVTANTMTDTLKILKAEADQKKLEAENLRAQTRTAYATAVRAQAAYITEEKRLKALSAGKSTDSVQEATAEGIMLPSSNPVSTPEDYHRDKIAQSEAVITNLEYELSKEKDRLDVYKQNLLESKRGESLTAPSSERDTRAEFWLEQIQTKYRHYHSEEVAMILDNAGLSSIDLCYLVVDMAGIIKTENKKNIEVIFKLVGCNGMITVPGFDPKRAAILQQIWNRPFDTNSRTIKPVNIQDMTDRFALELSFQKTLDIIRHCATVEHTFRSIKNKSDEQKERDRRIIEEWKQHQEFHGRGMMSEFCRHIDKLGINGASESTIRRIIKNI
ncbi:TPA: hypothetical protein N3A46_002083 [Salmonella enterica subsp. houtenae serovar 57:z4,z23:-]|nr:hypothetical protein [Salmonella enterica subsp. houtenae serovar 57:z4,z23:-]